MSNKQKKTLGPDSEYLLRMSHANITGSDNRLALLPAIIFTSIVILLIRLKPYKRPMSQFFWTSQSDDSNLSDFFNYYKMVLVLICAGIVILYLIFRFMSETMVIKRSKLYIPMAVYGLFIILSFIFSDYKEFSLLGWNERFEGTLPLLAYLLMAFFIMNMVNSEKEVKWMLYPVAGVSLILNVLGLLQGTGHDFFMTVAGQKLITANYKIQNDVYKNLYDAIEGAAANGQSYFSFDFNGQTYQTVFNPNYVSFYLAMMLPLMTMLLIHTLQKGSGVALWKKIYLGGIIALQIYNLFTSRSAGGYIGLALSVVLAIVILHKELLRWWKPFLVGLLILAAGLAATSKVWLDEVKHSLASFSTTSVTTREVTATLDELRGTSAPASVRPYFDYLYTEPESIELSIYGNPLSIILTRTDEGDIVGLKLLDKDENPIPLEFTEEDSGTFTIGDARFYEYFTLTLGNTDGTNYIILSFCDAEMDFVVVSDRIYYFNPYGKYTTISKTEHVGFEKNHMFGSGRGYIWSRSFPLVKDTIILGNGADTYCAVFPQDDYAGKYSDYLTLAIIVDKPHCLYLGTAINTGCISLAAMLAMFGIYLVQSFKLYFRREYGTDFLAYAGAGIFFGVVGFLGAALVNDSNINVMPMFYGIFATGVAVNIMLQKKDKAAKLTSVKA